MGKVGSIINGCYKTDCWYCDMAHRLASTSPYCNTGFRGPYWKLYQKILRIKIRYRGRVGHMPIKDFRSLVHSLVPRMRYTDGESSDDDRESADERALKEGVNPSTADNIIS